MPPSMRDTFVRYANSSPSDWTGIHQLCVATGDDGRPVASTRADLFPEIWISPYRARHPNWVWVLDSPLKDSILGYLTVCPDTPSFEAWMDQIYWPHFFIRRARSAWHADYRRAFRRWAGWERSPLQSFTRETREQITKQYPAHLHINLDETQRGRGQGVLLIRAGLDALKASGVEGVHVYCGAGPVRFYQSVGFDTLEEQTLATGSKVLALGLRLR